jgi:hypothetical protein
MKRKNVVFILEGFNFSHPVFDGCKEFSEWIFSSVAGNTSNMLTLLNGVQAASDYKRISYHGKNFRNY